MNHPPKSPKPHGRKRYYFLMALIYLPTFYCLAVINALWYGYAIAVATFLLMFWIRQTSAWKGWHAALCFALAFIVTFGGLSLSRPRWDASLPGQIGSGTLRVFMRMPVLQTVDAQLSSVSVWQAPEDFDYTVIALPDCHAELLSPKVQKSGFALLQLHGGAFVSPMNDLYRLMAVRYSDIVKGAVVLSPEYRLYPEYAYPAQQEDVMDAWHYLTDTLGYPADHILVAGDSAGGNLALSLTLQLRDKGDPLPAAVIGLSPWADLENAGESHIANATRDPTFGLTESAFDGVTPVGVPSTYAEGLDARDPYMSPTYGDYAGFPPMLLQAGDLEILLSDSATIAQNARDHGVDCDFTIYPDMFHVFQGSLDLLPEGREAWSEVAAFVGRVTGVTADTWR